MARATFAQPECFPGVSIRLPTIRGTLPLRNLPMSVSPSAECCVLIVEDAGIRARYR